MDTPFELWVGPGEIERGSWNSLDQAIEQGQLWLATITDFLRFSVKVNGEIVYTEAGEGFAPPRRTRPSNLSSLNALPAGEAVARLAA